MNYNDMIDGWLNGGEMLLDEQMTEASTGPNKPGTVEALGRTAYTPPRDEGRLFHQRLEIWLDTLTALANEGRVEDNYSYEIDPPRRAQRYARVVMSYNGAQRSVHAFYDLRTGDVYKAAGWKAPAKHVRYNLLDDTSFTDMMSRLDWTGGYLYMR